MLHCHLHRRSAYHLILLHYLCFLSIIFLFHFLELEGSSVSASFPALRSQTAACRLGYSVNRVGLKSLTHKLIFFSFVFNCLLCFYCCVNDLWLCMCVISNLWYAPPNVIVSFPVSYMWCLQYPPPPPLVWLVTHFSFCAFVVPSHLDCLIFYCPCPVVTHGLSVAGVLLHWRSYGGMCSWCWLLLWDPPWRQVGYDPVKESELFCDACNYTSKTQIPAGC